MITVVSNSLMPKFKSVSLYIFWHFAYTLFHFIIQALMNLNHNHLTVTMHFYIEDIVQ